MIATDELPPQATEYLKSRKISRIDLELTPVLSILHFWQGNLLVMVKY